MRHLLVPIVYILMFFTATTNTYALPTKFNKIYAEVLHDMPSELVQNLPKAYKIRLKDLNPQEINICSHVPVNFRYAAYHKRKKKIYISNSLYLSFLKCPKKLNIILRKKIAHELFHAYDFQKEIIQDEIYGCDNFSIDYSIESDEVCRELFWHNRRNTFISDDKRFHNIAQLHGKSLKSFKGVRLLSPYELESSKEFSATNFSAFMYDREYQCRRPTLYNYFKDIFLVSPFKNNACDATNYVIPARLGISKKIKIDPTRIYQIHYLMASKGESMMSRFGHSMLRFVVCAPARKDKVTGILIPATNFGEDCLFDLDYHFVASFRATIAENSLDLFGAFNGKYPSNLSILTFKEVLKEYNLLELRNLSSYPLVMNSHEKNNLINKIIETFWEYSGSYKFISNNCASETYKIIIGAINKTTYHLLEPNTPNQVLQTFIDNGLIRKEFLMSAKKNPQLYFQSKSSLFNDTFKILSSLKFPVKSLDTYLNIKPSERWLIQQETIKSIQNNFSNKKKKIRLLNSLLILEKQAFDLSLQNLEIKRSVYFFNLLNGTDETIKLKMIDLILTPHEILENSYGIPSREEFLYLEREMAKKKPTSEAGFLKELFGKKLKIEISDLEKSFENYKHLVKVKNKIKNNEWI